MRGHGVAWGGARPLSSCSFSSYLHLIFIRGRESRNTFERERWREKEKVEMFVNRKKDGREGGRKHGKKC